MRIHGVKVCCDRMNTYLTLNKITANVDESAVYIQILHTPTPEAGQDHELTLTVEQIYHCPGCGELIDIYSEASEKPNPVYTTITGGACNVSECPFNSPTNTCVLAQNILTIGCWMQNEDVKKMIQGLKTELDTGVDEAMETPST